MTDERHTVEHHGSPTTEEVYRLDQARMRAQAALVDPWRRRIIRSCGTLRHDLEMVTGRKCFVDRDVDGSIITLIIAPNDVHTQWVIGGRRRHSTWLEVRAYLYGVLDGVLT